MSARPPCCVTVTVTASEKLRPDIATYAHPALPAVVILRSSNAAAGGFDSSLCGLGDLELRGAIQEDRPQRHPAFVLQHHTVLAQG